MSIFDVATIMAVAGTAAGVIGAVVNADIVRRKQEVRREKTDALAPGLYKESVRLRNIIAHYDWSRTDLLQNSVTSSLIKQVEKDILQLAVAKSGVTQQEVQAEVENHMRRVIDRVEAIEKRLPTSEVIDKIASINDALFAQRIEQLTERLEKLERQILTKWDIAIVVCLILGGVSAVVAATYAVLKAMGRA